MKGFGGGGGANNLGLRMNKESGIHVRPEFYSDHHKGFLTFTLQAKVTFCDREMRKIFLIRYELRRDHVKTKKSYMEERFPRVWWKCAKMLSRKVIMKI